ncbi:hypothetical protein Aau02nite_32700 [Amorphoplanes auranticolor]|uniref:Bacterial toxin 44 domain-containing protein n=1 Tax=Actinoplanes auranticolor TaxID=47988 RepID=A0A919SBL0_9ACTN|nr:hypothetical protein Aau02nite_32700 [Actinoplanes auranticolor]
MVRPCEPRRRLGSQGGHPGHRRGDNRLIPISDTDTGISYDFWSNLHYGYVGIKADFPIGRCTAARTLPTWPRCTEPTTRDQAAVQIGIEMQERYRPAGITPDH